uniref:Uncharacterized protein n=1 Tax=Panagrolaimus sp. ES5 TaxID=591445 RepID=A0AC34GS01_9BILA
MAMNTKSKFDLIFYDINCKQIYHIILYKIKFIKFFLFFLVFGIHSIRSIIFVTKLHARNPASFAAASTSSCVTSTELSASVFAL